MAARRRPRILVTGFGPFPGAPENPTGPLVKALARKFRNAPLQLSTHVFRTTYKAVDRDLARLLKKHKPDAIVMFGLAGKSRGIRIETKAHNRKARAPDASFVIPVSRVIEAGAPASLPVRAPTGQLLRAAKKAGLPARLSVNAGDYLCNYLLWHATCATEKRGLELSAFVHLPKLSMRVTHEKLVTAGEAVMHAMISALRRRHRKRIRSVNSRDS